MDFLEIGRFAGGLALVLGLIALCAVAARRFGFVPAARARGQQARLGIVESAALDPKRRLVLVRRDGREHLLLLAPNRELVIETGIDPVSPDPARLSAVEVVP